MKNDAYRFSALSGTFYGLVYIGMIGASIACLVRSPKRNELLSRKHIWPACIASMALCVFEITSIVSQQMVFTGDNRYTPTHRWWGAFRTLFFQYLSPMLIMGLTYVNLIYFMDTTYQVVEESSTKAGIPDFMANSSVNQRQLLMAGTVLFGVVTTMISAFPGCFISFFAFLKPANDPLYSTYHGITNFWEAMFMINAILIGAILIGSAMMVYRSREKYSRTVGLFINQALILCFFEFYAWSRLSAVLIDKIGFNQMNATDIDSRGPVVMFCMYLTITVIFISGTLLSNSAMISNRIKDRTDQQIEYKGSASAYGTASASA